MIKMVRTPFKSKGLRAFFYTLAWSLAGALLLASCTTAPVRPEAVADPAAVLPAGEDFYLLARPSEHPVLIAEILREKIPVSPAELYPVLERTREGVFSGVFVPEASGLPVFSGQVEGDYPAFFVRSSLRNSPDWEKTDRYEYAGPGGMVAGTEFRDTLILAAGEDRLESLDRNLRGGLTGPGSSEDSAVLPESLVEWWRGGQPAAVLYLPDMGLLTLPEGLPSVTEGTVLSLGLTGSGEAEQYSLSAALTFPDSRSLRLWKLGIRIFLAGRLGLSPVAEERAVLSSIEMRSEGNTLHIEEWTMSARGWGRFLSSLNPETED